MVMDNFYEEIADVNLDFILTSEFTSTKIDEITLAKKNIFST